LVLPASEIHAQLGEQTSTMMKGSVSALNQQQLVVARRDCETQPEKRISAVAYCTEVKRTLEAQPLLVVVRPPPLAYF